jgi:uncharacterized protein YqhQ
MTQDKKPFQLGGQALIEGVMMRSPRYVAAAVRRADSSIDTRVEEFNSIFKTRKWLNVPFLRGTIALVEMLILGSRYLRWSSDIAMQDMERGQGKAEGVAPESHSPASDSFIPPPQPAPIREPDAGAEKAGMPAWMFALTTVISFSLGVGLFVALPNVITDWAVKPLTANRIYLNLAEGLVKLAIFVAYVGVIGTRPDIRRVFEYHGAEHKVVYAAENGLPITPAGARPFDTPHPRCGTGFALLTIVVSVICFSFLPWTQSHLPRVLWRLALLPVVAGVSFEIIKLTAHPKFGGLAQSLMIPGLWMQRLTTRQPDDAQLEVSCAAMQAILNAEADFDRRTKEPVVDPAAQPAGI